MSGGTSEVPRSRSSNSQDVRLEVTDVLLRYATGIDRRDWSAFRSCFTEECDVDYGDIGHWNTADEVTAWMRRMHDPLGPTLHRITNITMTEGTDEVQARCYVHGIITLPDRSAVHAYGFYDDRLVIGSSGWAISARRFTHVSTEHHQSMA